MIYKNGLIIGKFYPFHNGHKFLIEESIKKCERLTVLVCSLQRETIPGEIRYNWVKESFPNICLVHVTDENPQYPEEHPDFWNIWKKTIFQNHPEKIDVLFTSEEYGEPLSKVLGCQHICIDLDRKIFPISGTNVRENPLASWDFLPETVKPYFVKKIVITGPESCGKTTLSQNLARYFQTEWVPEYAREYLEARNNQVFYEDIEPICRGHIALEEKFRKEANKFLFIDTDPIITKMYSRIYFGQVPDFVLNTCSTRSYDLQIVLTPDVPWIADPLRDLPEQREEFFQTLCQELKFYNQNYKIVSGNFSERLERTVEITNSLLH